METSSQPPPSSPAPASTSSNPSQPMTPFMSDLAPCESIPSSKTLSAMVPLDVNSPDCQGLSKSILLIRKEARQRIDASTRPYLHFLIQKPRYDSSCVFLPRNHYLRPRIYLNKKDIQNTHFQLHNNFKAFSPNSFAYPSNRGLILLNSLTMESRYVLPRPGIWGLDQFKNLMLVGHENSAISMVNLESFKVWETSNLHYSQRELCSCIKFLPSGSAAPPSLIIGGNSSLVKIIDMEDWQKNILDIEVHENVNHIAINEQNPSLIAMCYDDPNVDIFDVRIGGLSKLGEAHSDTLSSSSKVLQLKGHKDVGLSVEFHPNGYTLASGNQDCCSRIWDIRGKGLGTVYAARTQTPANPKNVSAIPDTVGPCVAVLPTTLTAASCQKFTPDGQYLIVGENVSYVSIYSCVYNYCLGTRMDYFGELVGMDISKDSKKLYVGVGLKVSDVSPGIIYVDIGEDTSYNSLK